MTEFIITGLNCICTRVAHSVQAGSGLVAERGCRGYLGSVLVTLPPLLLAGGQPAAGGHGPVLRLVLRVCPDGQPVGQVRGPLWRHGAHPGLAERAAVIPLLLCGGKGGCVHQPLLEVLQQPHEQAALEAARLVDHVPHHAHLRLQTALHQPQQLKQPLKVCTKRRAGGQKNLALHCILH